MASTHIVSSAMSFLTSGFYIFAGIIGISFLIGFHELGHFLFAKMAGVYTPSFSIGFGRPLVQKKIGETTFKISAIPLGGYVEIAGLAEVGQGEQKEAHLKDERSFATKPFYQKLLIMSGGILFNLLFAYLAFIFLFAAGIPKSSSAFIPINARIGIENVQENSPAQRAGLQKGDIIESFNNVAVKNNIGQFFALLEQNAGKTSDVIVMRDGTEQTVHIALDTDPKSPFHGKMGIQLKFISEGIAPQGFLSAIRSGISATNELIKQTVLGFINIFRQRKVDGLGGPLMIISQIAQSSREGFKVWLLFLILISINLFILNLIPLPVFDGGQILFFTIEAIVGKSLSEGARMWIHYVNWILIMALLVYLSIKDIARFIFK